MQYLFRYNEARVSFVSSVLHVQILHQFTVYLPVLPEIKRLWCRVFLSVVSSVGRWKRCFKRPTKKKINKLQFLYRWNFPAARVCEILFWRTTTFLNNPDSCHMCLLPTLHLWTSKLVLVELLKEKNKKCLFLTIVGNEIIITRLYWATV